MRSSVARYVGVEKNKGGKCISEPYKIRVYVRVEAKTNVLSQPFARLPSYIGSFEGSSVFIASMVQNLENNGPN